MAHGEMTQREMASDMKRDGISGDDTKRDGTYGDDTKRFRFLQLKIPNGDNNMIYFLFANKASVFQRNSLRDYNLHS